MQFSPAQVKNLMRRGLRLLIDPEPETQDKERLRLYFDHRCAYCGTSVPQGQGDVDHLISAALGGANGLANRVLSCKPCNAQEKRDRDWLEFLKAKSGSADIFQERKTKIDRWVLANGGHTIVEETLLAALAEEAKRTTVEYDRACARIRSAATKSAH